MTGPGVLVAADPAALIARYLSTHPVLLEALGGSDRVGPRNRPPYPRVVITDQPGGTIRPTVWSIDTEYLIEVFGDPDGSHGKQQLRTIMLTVEGLLAELPNAPRAGGDPVVTSVAFFGSGGYTETADRQKRYIATVTVTSHPGDVT